MAKDKTVHEFVLSAYDEQGNLILAARGSEVVNSNINRLAMRFVGRQFILEETGTAGGGTHFRFKAVEGGVK